jgi:7,8-dihydroneopterin aldolase/epimerase/oxygenase
MDQLNLCELEVYYRVGVPAAERAQPQRLLISVELKLDLARAAASGELTDTLDYAALAQRLLEFGADREWVLIETVASDLAQMVLDEFGVHQVTVEVKKFVIPQARHVSVRLTRAR